MSTQEWKKENTKQYAVRFTYASGVLAALEKVKEDGKSANLYILEVLTEKLRGDGYLKDSK